MNLFPVIDGKSDGSAGKFYEWDYNHDGIITPDEVSTDTYE